jgi:amino acid transporter
VQYLAPVLPGGAGGGAAFLIKVLFILAITLLNIRGVRQSASINDVLTIAKLAPLILLVLLAVVFTVARPGVVHAHVQPFAPHGWSDFGRAMLPIFWAYAGFELAVLPASEVADSRRTLPRALIIGMTIATAFYLFSSAAVVAGLPSADAAASTRPLAETARRMLDSLSGGGDIALAALTAGAIVSIIGVYDVFTLGLARLSYALARDGLFPAPFARTHPKFGTPYVGVLFQGASALVFASLFDIRGLISTSVLFLSITYLLTALAALRLASQHPDRALHLPGLRILLLAAAASAIFLAAQASVRELITAIAVMAAGVGLYVLETKRWLAGRPALRAGEREIVYWERRFQDWLLRSIRRRGAPPRRLR